jgi:hypothetical protein
MDAEQQKDCSPLCDSLIIIQMNVLISVGGRKFVLPILRPA